MKQLKDHKNSKFLSNPKFDATHLTNLIYTTDSKNAINKNIRINKANEYEIRTVGKE